jgi:hypothetical protein
VDEFEGLFQTEDAFCAVGVVTRRVLETEAVGTSRFGDCFEDAETEGRMAV